jgi:hypothetical protein
MPKTRKRPSRLKSHRKVASCMRKAKTRKCAQLQIEQISDRGSDDSDSGQLEVQEVDINTNEANT